MVLTCYVYAHSSFNKFPEKEKSTLHTITHVTFMCAFLSHTCSKSHERAWDQAKPVILEQACKSMLSANQIDWSIH